MKEVLCAFSHKAELKYIVGLSKINQNMPFEFKPLEVQQEKNVFKRIAKSRHLQKTFLYMILGSTISFLLSFMSADMNWAAMQSNEIWQSVIMGAAFGLFITNSPCARGKC